MDKSKILVIEDEEDILALVHYNLVKAGFHVDIADKWCRRPPESSA